MTVTDIFRDIKLATDVERDVMQVMERWLPVYVQEVEIQQGIIRGSIPMPESYMISEEIEAEQGARLPSIVVVSPGMNRPPLQEGDGSFRGFYSVGVAIIASASNRDNTKYLVRLYCAAIAALMMQRQSDYGEGTAWVDQSYDDDLPFPDNQTVNVGTNVFEIEVDSILNRYGGPATSALPDSDTQPGSHWPIAESGDVKVEQLP